MVQGFFFSPAIPLPDLAALIGSRYLGTYIQPDIDLSPQHSICQRPDCAGNALGSYEDPSLRALAAERSYRQSSLAAFLPTYPDRRTPRLISPPSIIFVLAAIGGLMN